MRFRLKALFALTTTAALFLTFFEPGVERAVRRSAAIQSLCIDRNSSLRDGHVVYDNRTNHRSIRGNAILNGVAEIRLNGPDFSDDDMELLALFPELSSLRLQNTSVSDHGLSRLATLSRLKTLSLSYSQAISNEGMANVSRLGSLRTLSIDTISLSDDSLAELCKMRHLERLSLLNTRISTTGMRRLKEQLPSTRIFPINAFVSFEMNALIKQVQALGGTIDVDEEYALTEVSFQKNANEGIRLLARHGELLPKLARLSLSDSDVTSEAFVDIGRFPSLEEVNVLSTGVSFDDVQQLSKKISAEVRWSPKSHQ